eukprot:SAG31_NODE_719_length_12605_cov_22.378858_10_plen_86_part_00
MSSCNLDAVAMTPLHVFKIRVAFGSLGIRRRRCAQSGVSVQLARDTMAAVIAWNVLGSEACSFASLSVAVATVTPKQRRSSLSGK